VRTWKRIFFCFFSREDYYTWDRASEPSDVYWENLSTQQGERILRTLFSLFVTLCISSVCFAAVYGLVLVQKSTKGGGSINAVLSILIAVIISVINGSLQFAMKKLALYERK
jgi:hypothetical protein